MLLGDLVDTVMNLSVFAFLGAMAWILMRSPANKGDKSKTDAE